MTNLFLSMYECLNEEGGGEARGDLGDLRPQREQRLRHRTTHLTHEPVTTDNTLSRFFLFNISRRRTVANLTNPLRIELTFSAKFEILLSYNLGQRHLIITILNNSGFFFSHYLLNFFRRVVLVKYLECMST